MRTFPVHRPGHLPPRPARILQRVWWKSGKGAGPPGSQDLTTSIAFARYAWGGRRGTGRHHRRLRQLPWVRSPRPPVRLTGVMRLAEEHGSQASAWRRYKAPHVRGGASDPVRPAARCWGEAVEVSGAATAMPAFPGRRCGAVAGAAGAAHALVVRHPLAVRDPLGNFHRGRAGHIDLRCFGPLLAIVPRAGGSCHSHGRRPAVPLPRGGLGHGPERGNSKRQNGVGR